MAGALLSRLDAEHPALSGLPGRERLLAAAWLGSYRSARTRRAYASTRCAPMQAVALGVSGGQAQPVEQLSARVHAVLDAKQRCLHGEIGMMLPVLVRDLHTSIDAGRDVAELLRLADQLLGVDEAPQLGWNPARRASDGWRRCGQPAHLTAASAPIPVS